MKDKIKLIIGILLFALLVGALTIISWRSENAQAGLAGKPISLIGTRVGTTTTGAGFYTSYAASSTYRAFVGGENDTVTLSFLAQAASTTPTGGAAGVYMSILGSSDSGCHTSSTTGGSMNPILDKDINWYDLIGHVKNLSTVSQTSLFPTSTSTIFWNTSGKAGDGRQIILTELNTDCIMLKVAASSTVLYAEIKAKQD